MGLKVTMLESVGSAITDDSIVYPLKVDNTPDMNMGVHLDDCSGEWWARLSISDKELIDKGEIIK